MHKLADQNLLIVWQGSATPIKMNFPQNCACLLQGFAG